MDNASTTEAEGLDIIKRAEAALEGTTPGPWNVHDASSMGYRCTHYFEEVWNNEFDILVTTEVTRAHNDGGRKNMRFIAASRQLVPELVEALKAERDRAERAEAMAEKLAEALTFYADENLNGYDVCIGDYGLSLSTGEIIKDEGDKARAALTAYQAQKRAK